LLLLITLMIALPALFLGLGWAPLLDWDENIYAEVARQIMLRGEHLILYLNGHQFWEKPPLFLWEMASFFRMFGVSEYVARLPSAVNGLLFVIGIFVVGSRFVGTTFAGLWSLMYLTTFLPLLLARSAVIDHTFNALITAAVFLLVLYDQSREAVRPGIHSRWRYWWPLLLASVVMGLAVLTKGPLGGAIPLVAYVFYKLGRGRTWPHPLHILVCGVVSLSIGLSWYLANYAVAGPDFLDKFINFQRMLLSRPLEGHDGPFYYHFLVGLVGLFPWTPLLLLYFRVNVRQALWQDDAIRPLIVMCLGWTGFVLLVFSIVQNKLPHYSSVMYVPLTFLIALALSELVRQRQHVSFWLGGMFVLYGSAFGVGMAVLPYFMQVLALRGRIELSVPPTPADLAWWPGALLAAGAVIGGLLLIRGGIRTGVVVMALVMGLFMPGMWRIHLPLFTAYNQGAVIDLMQRAYAQNGELLLYRMVSFAVLFYGQQEVEMLHTYKFPGNPDRLDEPAARPLFVITPKQEAERLKREHPLLERVAEEGRLAMYRLPPRPG